MGISLMVTLFTNPFLYGRFPVFSRTDDHRFDHNPAALNRSETKIGVVDGTTAAKIIAKQFPQSTMTSMPENASFSQLFEDIAQKKTDATLQAASLGALYMKNNPGKIHEVPDFETVRILPHIFILRGGEYRLKNMLDAALLELGDTGTIEEIVQKYDPGKQSYLLPAPAYSKNNL
jgi:ABC-type amino acid transport substrate-binding protein